MEQQSTSRRTVTLAAVAVVLAVVAFGAAFYLLDGMSVVNSLLAGESPVESPVTPPSSKPATGTAELKLPAGMPQDFALRLWQEQVDSQGSIGKLIGGEVRTLHIDDVEKSGDVAKLHVTVSFKDGTSAPGIIAMRNFGGTWYLAYATGIRAGEAEGAGGVPTSPLPDLADVDVALLNTILQQNTASKAITQEYVDKVVMQVNLQEPQRGPDTTTIKMSMNETHETGYGQIVAVRKEIDGRELWFLARFTKTQNPNGS